ncbi:hypothetical protein GCM10029978_067990 [Actinoallomurus acanthiterrae]
MTIDATGWAAGEIGSAIDSSGQLDITKPWFAGTYQSMRNIAMAVALIGLLLSMLYAAAKRDGAEIGRTLVRVLTAGLTTGAIVIFVTWGDALIGTLCDQILGGKKGDGWKQITAGLAGPATYLRNTPANDVAHTSGIDLPMLVTELLALLLLITLLIIWLEMVIRSVCISVCVIWWPMSVAGSVWVGAQNWTRRTSHTIIAFLASKFFLAVDMRLGRDALLNVHSPSDCLKGIGIVLLGASGPFIMMRLVGFTDGAIQPSHTGEGLRQMATGAAIGAGMQAVRLASGAGGGAAGAAGKGMQAGGKTQMPPVRGPRELGSEDFQNPFPVPGKPPADGNDSGRSPTPPPPPRPTPKDHGGAPQQHGRSDDLPGDHHVPATMSGSGADALRMPPPARPTAASPGPRGAPRTPTPPTSPTRPTAPTNPTPPTPPTRPTPPTNPTPPTPPTPPT